MSSTFVTGLLWIIALSSGLMAGIYFTFSGFVMKALGELEVAQSVAVMNSINKTILHSLFIPLFFGSTIISLILIVIALMHWGEERSGLILIAGLVYFLGMFVCTVVFNVPLNNLLAGINESSTNNERVWLHYSKTWTYWNHLRTVSSLAACGLSIWLLLVIEYEAL